MATDTGSSSGAPRSPDPPLSALFPPIIPSSTIYIDEYSKPIIPPHTTQRCLTFCSQSSSRRDVGWDPVCRAVCWKVDRSVGVGKEKTISYLDRKRAEQDRQTRKQVEEDEKDGAFSFSRRSDSRLTRTVPEPSILDEFSAAVSRWINQRSVTFFKGTLEEMVEMQREGQAQPEEEYAMASLAQPHHYGIVSAEINRAQKRWEEVSGIEAGLAEVTERLEKQIDLGDIEENAPIAHMNPILERPTTLAERKFIKLVKDEQDRLERYQKQRESARSFVLSDPRRFNYHHEPLPSGGTNLTVPLTSFFITPFYAIQHRASFIFSPVTRLARGYVQSFKDPEDGTGKCLQVKGVERIYDQVASGKVLEFGGKFLGRVGEVWGGWLGLAGRDEKPDGPRGDGNGNGSGNRNGRRDD